MEYNRHKPGTPLPDFQDGDIVNAGNYSRDIEETVTAAIIVNGGNLVNVNAPNATFNGGLHCKKDYCYWLHGANTDFPKNLPIEAEDCRHVIDTISLDGVPIEYIREDITGSY